MNSEIRLYEALGIRIFQKLVFRLERFRHRADGDRNVNYHLLPYGETSPERFIRYLYLNAGIHISGLAATIVFSLIFAVMPGTLPTVWAVCFVGVIGNIYCIMLQRYNALRLRKYQSLFYKRMKKREEKNARILRDRIPEGVETAQIVRDAEWICGLKEAVEDGEIFVIEGEEDTGKLRRLAEWFELAGINGRIVRQNIAPSSETEASVRQYRSPALYSKAERNARLLRRALGKEKRNDKLSCCIIVIGSDNTQAFNRLFPAGSEEMIVETVETLRLAAAQPESEAAVSL